MSLSTIKFSPFFKAKKSSKPFSFLVFSQSSVNCCFSCSAQLTFSLIHNTPHFFSYTYTTYPKTTGKETFQQNCYNSFYSHHWEFPVLIVKPKHNSNLPKSFQLAQTMQNMQPKKAML